MKKTAFRLAIALAACSACSAAHAALTIKELHWQVATSAPARKDLWHDTANWLYPPGSKPGRAPRVLVTLLNGTGKPDEAILLRYSLSARLAPSQGGAEGVWTLPFVLQERRVPKVQGNELQVPITLNRALFDAYFKRMLRAGFWPDSLRMQVMVEPRPGESSFEGRLAEVVLPVLWKQPASGGAK
jgi:hypothetical protein